MTTSALSTIEKVKQLRVVLSDGRYLEARQQQQTAEAALSEAQDRLSQQRQLLISHEQDFYESRASNPISRADILSLQAELNTLQLQLHAAQATVQQAISALNEARIATTAAADDRAKCHRNADKFNTAAAPLRQAAQHALLLAEENDISDSFRVRKFILE